MQTAGIFTNSNSLAVRLPKDFRFEEDEVVIKTGGHRRVFPQALSSRKFEAILQEIGLIEIECQQPAKHQEQDFQWAFIC